MFSHCWFAHSKQEQEDERNICQAKQTLWNALEARREIFHRGITDFFFFLSFGWDSIILSRSPFCKPLSFQSAPDERVFPLTLTSFSFLSFPSPGCRIENCESCFSKDFCTKCKSGFYLHKGRCFDKCPEGFTPLEDTMECGGTCNKTHMSKEFGKMPKTSYISLTFCKRRLEFSSSDLCNTYRYSFPLKEWKIENLIQFSSVFGGQINS